MSKRRITTMLDLHRPSDQRRLRQIRLLDTDYLARSVRATAESCDACSRRSRQIMFDARLVLDTASQQIEVSRQLLDRFVQT